MANDIETCVYNVRRKQVMGLPTIVRAKAGLPWPVTGTYTCDKCHAHQTGETGVIAARCTALRAGKMERCNCAYFVLVPVADHGTESDG